MYKHRGFKQREENVYNHTFQFRFQAKERFFSQSFFCGGSIVMCIGVFFARHTYILVQNVTFSPKLIF